MKAGRDLLTKKSAEIYLKPGKAIPTSLPMEVQKWRVKKIKASAEFQTNNKTSKACVQQEGCVIRDRDRDEKYKIYL